MLTQPMKSDDDDDDDGKPLFFSPCARVILLPYLFCFLFTYFGHVSVKVKSFFAQRNLSNNSDIVHAKSTGDFRQLSIAQSELS